MSGFDLDASISKDELKRAVWLKDAWRHVPCRTGAQMEAIKQERLFADLNEGLLPDTHLLNHGYNPKDYVKTSKNFDAESATAWRLYWAMRESASMMVRVELANGSLLAFGFPDERTLTPHWISPRLWSNADISRREECLISNAGYSYSCVKVVVPALVVPKTASLSQNDVNRWMQEYYQSAFERDAAPPKRAEDAFPACRDAIGATDEMMREAMKTVPNSQKRPRGRPQVKSGG